MLDNVRDVSEKSKPSSLARISRTQWERRVCLINGFGKTGDPYAEE